MFFYARMWVGVQYLKRSEEGVLFSVAGIASVVAAASVGKGIHLRSSTRTVRGLNHWALFSAQSTTAFCCFSFLFVFLFCTRQGFSVAASP